MTTQDISDPGALSAQYLRDYEALPEKRAALVWQLRRAFTKTLHEAQPAFVLAVARALFRMSTNPSHATCLLMLHKKTFETLGEMEIEEFGQGINSWESVDSFGRWLAGPAWLAGQISDDLIRKWAHSQDMWWRRAALVSTVALNMRSHGGHGDTKRTLAVCELLVDDHDDMIVKALSWALRVLVVHDPQAVRGFLKANEEALAARVKREVRNKLTTGLKNP